MYANTAYSSSSLGAHSDPNPNGHRWVRQRCTELAAERRTLVSAHGELAEAEVNCFRARLMVVASGADENPMLPKYDQFAAFKKGPLPSTTDALANFRRERQVSLQLLHALPATVGSRTGRHERLGILTFLEMLNEFAFHDVGHMRQILELCRARAYYPHIGGWRTYYKVNP